MSRESSVRSKRERHELDYKKKVLSLAKQHRLASDMEKVDRYYMPTNDKVSAISAVSLTILSFLTDSISSVHLC